MTNHDHKPENTIDPALLSSFEALQRFVDIAAADLHRVTRRLEIDVGERLTCAVQLLELDAAGVLDSIAFHRPLLALAAAGQLDGVLCILRALAEHPERFGAVYELAHGSSLEIVAGELLANRSIAR